MSAQTLGFLGVVIAAVVGSVGIYAAARLGKKGSDRTAALQERATLLAPYSQMRSDLTAELERQRADSNRDRERSAEDRDRIAALEEITGRLTERLEISDTRYREAIRYIRIFRAWVSERMPGAHDAPRVPAVLEADLEE